MATEIEHPRAVAIVMERARVVRSWLRLLTSDLGRESADAKFERDLKKIAEVIAAFLPMFASILPEEERRHF